MVLKLRLGDTVRLKKVHPCGSYRWLVVRLGADIGLECSGCQRRTLLQRSYLERKVREIVPREPSRSMVRDQEPA